MESHYPLFTDKFLVKNLFQCMKVFHSVATHCKKLDGTFFGFVHIADTMKWLD